MSGRLVLLRHGQTHGNVERRLDTRPPGAELTELGREQARTFARALPEPPALIAHSTAIRAAQTAHEIRHEVGAVLGDGVRTPANGQAPDAIGAAITVGTHEVEGIHEVQVGELENRSDEAAHEHFNAVYQRWHGGEHHLALPGGESALHVLERYVPALQSLRIRYLDNDAFHGDIVVVSHGAAIRLVSAVLTGVDSRFAIDHHLANMESVVLAPVADGRWSCLQWGSLTPPFGDAPVVTHEPEKARSANPLG